MKRHTNRLRIIAALCAICTGAWLLLQWTPVQHSWLSWPTDRLALAELAVRDVLHSGTIRYSPDPRLVFVGIDQTSYADIIAPEEAALNPTLAELTNSFPWSREVWAAAVERLAGAGAKVVMLDLVFASPGRGDDRLRAALERYEDRVVIGANFTGGKQAGGEGASIVYPSESVVPYKDANKPWMDSRVGFVNFFTGPEIGRRDVDDVVRRAVFRVSGERGLPPDATLGSIGSRALQKLGEGNRLPPDSRPHLFRYVAPPGDGFRPIPLYSIFLPSFWSNNFENGKFFDGKVVIIGPAANILHDDHATPFRAQMLGPEIHLNAMNAVLRGDFLYESSPMAEGGLIIGSGLLAFVLAFVVKSPVRRLFVAVGCVVLFVLVCAAAIRFGDSVLLAVAPVLAFSSSTLTCFAYDFVLLRLEKNRTRRIAERYVSKEAVREILDNPDTFLNALGGVRKPLTILFSDVRGFTTMTEGADPGQLVKQLNEYFNEMVRVVWDHKGRLDKFIGDAVMADWGGFVTFGVAKDAQLAVATALDMKRSLARLNITWLQRGMTELAFGIGINHGDVIFGNLGHEEKREVSVIGDPVNLASRLEGLTKEYKLDLLLGESMAPLVQERFALRSVDSVQVKGKKKPVHVFTVVADKEAGEQSPAWLTRYEEGVVHYRARRFNDGLAAFADCVRWQPEDYLSQLYLRRCQELVANPPGSDWDTVFVMKSK